MICLLLVVIPLCADTYSQIVAGIPEYCSEYISDAGICNVFVREYRDAVIIEKTLSAEKKRTHQHFL